jgi:uncharacterized protein (TIGR02646 family)
MIRVDRRRVDGLGVSIQPSRAWFDRASTFTAKVIADHAKHFFQSNVYAHEEVSKALEELFHQKCAYCEVSLARTDWDVDHFRPKGRIAERKDHPGYYWLAYTWENLFPSCTWCNQHRKARPTWSGEPGIASGKLDQFPLEKENDRALTPRSDLDAEERLVLDPCRDQPEQHFQYDLLGGIRTSAGSKKGNTSINVFKLGEPRLRKARQVRISEIVAGLRLLETVKTRGPGDIEAAHRLIQTFTRASSQFAGATRYVIACPEEFGVRESAIKWAL